MYKTVNNLYSLKVGFTSIFWAYANLGIYVMYMTEKTYFI